MNGITIEVDCPFCNSKNIPYRYEKRIVSKQTVLLGLNKCTNCNLQYISPRLDQTSLSNLYDSEYHSKTVSGAYNVNESVSVHEYSMFKSYLLKLLPAGGGVLDVGCGVGNMLQQLREHSQYSSKGIEISKEAAAKASQNGHNVFQGNLIQANFEDESFDAIYLLYVLEHVDNPAEILKEIYRILKKNGILLLAVPNYRYLRIAFDNFISRTFFKKSSTLHPEEHLQNFTPTTLKMFIKKAGFDIVKENCAKPLNIGNPAVRFFKQAMYYGVKFMSVLGYNIGGIHLIARKK